MATETQPRETRSELDGYVPRLQQRYVDDVRPRLKDDLGVSSVMQVPKIQKITLNMGVGEAKTDARSLDAAAEQLATISGSSRRSGARGGRSPASSCARGCRS